MDIKLLRSQTGLSRKDFAKLVGVSPASIARWEKGDVSPNPTAQVALREIQEAINRGSISSLIEKARARREDTAAEERIQFQYAGTSHEAVLSPYVSNCPEDQSSFYKLLIEMQQHASEVVPWEQYKTRLSLLKSLDGSKTSQYTLEAPRNGARSWTPNMGPHGWHRYVGRFPAQLIRAIMNRFNVSADSTVLDPFCGSGTTLVESRLLGAKSIGIEISPLSAMICRAKSQFPTSGESVTQLASEYSAFFEAKLSESALEKDSSYSDILNRQGNPISTFPNIEKWFTKEALLGVSITVEFIQGLTGYSQDIMELALSACMRSIGNVDVDVVRAEYSRQPRSNVDVCSLVSKKLRRIASSIDATVSSHSATIASPDSALVVQGDCRTVSIPEHSVDCVITSPPYGTESLSYLRTHLLSFRSLEPILGIDPYNFGGGVIGSEFLDDNVNIDLSDRLGESYLQFFSRYSESEGKLRNRVASMSKFFVDLDEVISNICRWLKDDGEVAFVIGNKRIGDDLIPTSEIVIELFKMHGFALYDSINHKLKTNNSNSVVPWQSRIIDDEYVLFFKRIWS